MKPGSVTQGHASYLATAVGNRAQQHGAVGGANETHPEPSSPEMKEEASVPWLCPLWS